MSTSDQTDNKSIGVIDERGYLNGFGRRGFTMFKSFLELLANMLDAFDALNRSGAAARLSRKKIAFIIDTARTRFIDNAMGMTETDAENMAALHKENHISDTARGVSGIGAKPSMSKLSGKKLVEVHTRKVGAATGYVISYPWNAIHEAGRYTGMVTIRKMTAEEEAAFHKEREENGMLNEQGEAHGTTTYFPTNASLSDVIRKNFAPIESTDMNVLDRAGIVFGREDVSIVCKDYECVEDKTMEMYDYFGEDQSKYYQGVNEEIIEQWYSKKNDEDRFIWRKNDGSSWEILKDRRGYTKEAKSSTTNTNEYLLVGTYRVRTGLRDDKKVFDRENPEAITGTEIKPEYNTRHLNSDETFSGTSRLVRNGQIIGLIPCGVSIAAAKRGTGESNFKYLLMQCEVCFNPVSIQKDDQNHQDRAMNIQENKNQFDGESLPQNFTRLVKDIKNQKAAEIWNVFQTILDRKREEEEAAAREEEEAAAREEEEARDEEARRVREAEEAAARAARAEQIAREEGARLIREAEEALAGLQGVVHDEEGDHEEEESSDEESDGNEDPSHHEQAQGQEQDQDQNQNQDQGQEQEQNRPPPPVDVRPFRRGGVFGHELKSELQRIIAALVDDTLYSDQLLQLYNDATRV